MPIATPTLEAADVLKDLSWMQAEIFGNSVYSYLLTISSFVLLWIVLHVARSQLVKRVERVVSGQQSPKMRDIWTFVQGLINRIRPLTLSFIALYFATKRLSMAPTLERAFNLVVMVVVITQAATLLGQLASYVIAHQRTTGRGEDPVVKNTNRNLIALAKIAIWVGAVLFMLDNAGFNVSTFVAGLGIGGIAIALAAQAMLGDAFSSFAIALDKPFEVGDFVIIDAFQGTIEHIGLKTTRIRSLGGELLIFGNSDLTGSRIKNYKKMSQRRIVFNVGVTYDTPLPTLLKIPDLIAQIVQSQEKTRLDRSHFARHAASALEFEVVYFLDNPDYNAYMDVQQRINFRILEEFERLGVAMAFPTQTIHIAGKNASPPPTA